MSTPPEINVPELFAMLGRMEGKLDGLSTLPSRVSALEGEMQVVKASAARDQSRRAPWWVVVGVVFGAITASGGLLVLLINLNQIAKALETLTL